jgi:hypothetical protein
MSNGVCEYGYGYIDTASECEDAAKALGLVDQGAGSGSSTSSPYGCYYKASSSSGSRLWLNLAGTGSSYDTDRTALCQKYSWNYDTSHPENAPADLAELNKANEAHKKAVLTTVIAVVGGCAAIAAVAVVVIRKRSQTELQVALAEDGYAEL